jgi:hypothetical protein
VKISTMKVMTMMEMERHIKLRYDFAMSAFARMYGVKHVMSSSDIPRFCKKWAETEGEEAPFGTISEINFYFLDFWKTWGGYL